MPTPVSEANTEVRRLGKQIERGNLSRLEHLNAIRSHYRELERGVRFYGQAPDGFRLVRIAAHAIALRAMEIERVNGVD